MGPNGFQLLAPLKEVERHGPGDGVRRPGQQALLREQWLVERYHRRKPQVRRGCEVLRLRLVQEQDGGNAQTGAQGHGQSESQFHGPVKLRPVPVQSPNDGGGIRGGRRGMRCLHALSLFRRLRGVFLFFENVHTSSSHVYRPNSPMPEVWSEPKRVAEPEPRNSPRPSANAPMITLVSPPA